MSKVKQTPSFEEAERQVQDLLRKVAGKPDAFIWVMACATVAVAGYRAFVTKQPDIEQLCTDFVDGMHKFAGTPPLKETEQ